MPDEHNLQDLQNKIENLSAKVNELDKEKNNIISHVESKTISGIKKWISYWIGGGILSLLITYVTIYLLVTTKSADYIVNSIKEKFAEPEITQTLNEVAQNQAHQIIENNLTPAIKKATSSIMLKIESFDKNLQEFNDKYDLELKKIAKEVEHFRNRNEVLKLSDAAIATGDAASFEELENIFNTSTDDNIKKIALSEILRVKNYIATMTRIKGVEIEYIHRQSGKKLIGKELSTETLIKKLQNEAIWQYRAKIAELLRSRKEKEVPEALLDAIKSDKILEVRKKAMDSFQSVTGFSSRDVINYKPAKEWWEENKKNVEKDLNDLQTMKEAEIEISEK